ncbi:insecticidal delta-endotoxin Cry8Ea1 family protein, partial [Bacillus cereus]|nr:insecticidal delta-endotoxin Cry8Ea1 family protein [Bacillus cereus]
MSEGDYIDSYINPGNVRTGLQTGIDIVAVVVGALGGPVGGILTGFLSTLFGFLWPSNDQAVWEAFIEQMEELIEQRISDQVVRTALDDLTGIQNYYNQYLIALKEWEERPNGVRANLVLQRFEILHALFVSSMPSFGSGPGSQRFQAQLLVVYAQAANLHLLLLADAEKYGARWGLRESQIELYFNELQTRTRDYTNHCVNAYNNGLAGLRGTSAESWLKYHQFRREATLMAMDLIALFPYYNTRRYPIAVNPQLTREVYTDPLGVPSEESSLFPELRCLRWQETSAMTFSNLENAIIRPPHLFDTINNLMIYTGSFRFTNNQLIEGWIGHSVTSSLLASGPTTVVRRNYGSTTSIVNYFSFNDRDVYQINTRSHTGLGFQNAPLFGITRAQFYPGGTYSVTQRNALTCEQNYNSIDELPSLDPNEPISRSYSHRLSHITSYLHRVLTIDGINIYSGNLPTYVWTHRDVDLTNTITADRITQLPLVKSFEIPAGTTVVRGPGFTGGDILRRTGVGTFGTIRVRTTAPLTQRYRIRFRFASTTNLFIGIRVGDRQVNYFDFGRTMNRGDELRYESFATREFTTDFNFRQPQELISVFANAFSAGQEVYFDRIEIIPVNPAREAKEDLEAAKKAVASLFTRTRDGLQVNVKDYQVDQAANLVSCLSDEQYGYDKKMLLEAVRAAKRLSRERNLLQDPDFNTINSTEENGWKASNGVTISEGGPFYKGRALQLASARENYPTYIYQKVDASELKPYTRYRLDGFVKSSQDLEIDLIHHHKVHLVKNVPDNLVSDTYPDDSCSGINRCQE